MDPRWPCRSFEVNMHRITITLVGLTMVLMTSEVSAQLKHRRGSKPDGPRVRLTYPVTGPTTFKFNVPVVVPGNKQAIIKASVVLKGGYADRLKDISAGKSPPNTVLRARRKDSSLSVDLGFERLVGYGRSQRTTFTSFGHGSVVLPKDYKLLGEDKAGEVTFGLTRGR
jgi:hypothetical protein